MRARKTPLLMSLIFILGASLLFAAAGDGLWMTKVPERAAGGKTLLIARPTQ